MSVTVRRLTRTIRSIAGVSRISPGPRWSMRRPRRNTTPRSYSRSTRTDMAAPALEDPKTRNKVFATIPLGRVGKPEEIAAPVLFLCTDHAGFITGEIVNVNGGAVLVG